MYKLIAERDGLNDKPLLNSCSSKKEAEKYIEEHLEEYEGWDFTLKNDKEIWVYLGDGEWEDCSEFL